MRRKDGVGAILAEEVLDVLAYIQGVTITMTKVESYQMTVAELPDCWRPQTQNHDTTCRYCHLRKEGELDKLITMSARKF